MAPRYSVPSVCLLGTLPLADRGTKVQLNGRAKLLRLSRGFIELDRIDSRRTNHEPLGGEGRLLLSHASIRFERWFRAADRQIAAQASPSGRQVLPEPGPPLSVRDLGAGKVLEHLPGDVTLQDPDDLALGAAFLGPPLHVFAGAGVE